jgi:hypothetical protein
MLRWYNNRSFVTKGNIMADKSDIKKASYNHTQAAREDIQAIFELQRLNATEAVHRGLSVLRCLLEAQAAGNKIQVIDPKTGETTRIVLM